MNVKTGYGYFKDKDNNIMAKYDLPFGEHPLKDDYTYVEVNSKYELDSIEVFEPPKSQEQLEEEKIQIEIRNAAIERLKAKGEL